jgi:hypothetical protein
MSRTRLTRHARRRMKTVVVCMAAAISVGLSASPAGAVTHSQSIDYTKPDGTAYGTQATWTIGGLGDNQTDMLNGGFTLHSLWASTDGGSFVATCPGSPYGTWIELGVTRGYAGSTGLFYYSAHGINRDICTGATGLYSEINLNTDPSVSPHPPLPVVGESHSFSIRNSIGSNIFFDIIDNTAWWSFSGHNPPTADFGIGFESTCSSCTGTYVQRTPVSGIQWADSSWTWHAPSNGQFLRGGGTPTLNWCTQFTSFVDGLNVAPSTVTC